MGEFGRVFSEFWASIGEFWRVWESLGEFGRVLGNLGEFGRVRGSLREFERVWESLGEFGRVMRSLGEFGRVWWSLREFERVWESLGEFGRVWEILGKFGRVLKSFGRVCKCIDQYSGKTTVTNGKRFKEHWNTCTSVKQHLAACKSYPTPGDVKVQFLESVWDRGKFSLSEREFLWTKRLKGTINVQKVISN